MSKNYYIEVELCLKYNKKNFQTMLEKGRSQGLTYKKGHLDLQKNNLEELVSHAFNTLSYKKAIESAFEHANYILAQKDNNIIKIYFFKTNNKNILMYIDFFTIPLKKDFKIVYDIDFEYYLNILLNALEPFCIKSLSAEGF